ncbi:MAG: 2-C-methyl-D-erythritol 4-phosphate cytidylyltransferase [Gammaproteobacteria bacterium]
MAENPPLPDSAVRCWAIVPAAGSGRRMASGIPKQYLPLCGMTVLEHTLDTLLACTALQGIVVVLAADDRYWPGIESRYAASRLERVSGGAERCHSVLNAIHHLSDHAAPRDWVLVHDAARPCLRVDDIVALINTLAADPHGGLLGVPVTDTMKRSDAQDRITATVDRQCLWHAQTPQMFRLESLRVALEDALAKGIMVTDEAAAMELAGYRPRLVRGHADNLKVTVPSDLGLAEYYLQQRQE